MSTLTQAHSVLAVSNLNASVHFYTHCLAMQIEHIDAGWAFLSRDGFNLMLGDCPAALPAAELGDHAYFAYVTVQKIDALYAEFSSKAVEFIKPIRTEAWGMREFGIRTLDGHRILFGEALDELETPIQSA